MWLSKLGGSGHYAGSPVGVAGALAQANATVASVGTVGMNSTPMGASLLPGGGSSVGVGAPMSTSELHLEGLSAGEALQQMSVLVSSYMDTLQALQGQLMGNDRWARVRSACGAGCRQHTCLIQGVRAVGLGTWCGAGSAPQGLGAVQQ